MLSRSSSFGGYSSITVSKDVDFPLPAVPTRTTLVMDFFGDSSFHFSFIDFVGTRSP